MWAYSGYNIGTRESIYPPNVLNLMWDSYRAEWNASWERIYTALTAEYNPLENTDRYEKTTDTTTHTGTDGREENATLTKTGADTLTRTGSATNATTLDTTVSGETKNTAKESAFNSYTNPSVDNIVDGTNTTKTSGGDINTLTNNLEDKTEHNTEDKNEVNSTRTVNLTDKLVHENHTHGNIGVTTNVAMLKEELDFRQKYYLFNQIVLPFLYEQFV